MPVDATPPEAPGPAIEWKLPSVREIAIRRVRGEPPPKLQYFRSSVPELPEVVEFEIVLDGPLPGRALPPVLYVGETPVFQRRVDPDAHRHVFQAPPNQLRQDEEISFGWYGDPPQQRMRTGQRYRAP